MPKCTSSASAGASGCVLPLAATPRASFLLASCSSMNLPNRSTRAICRPGNSRSIAAGSSIKSVLRSVTDRILRPATDSCSPRATVSTSGSSGMQYFSRCQSKGVTGSARFLSVHHPGSRSKTLTRAEAFSNLRSLILTTAFSDNPDKADDSAPPPDVLSTLPESLGPLSPVAHRGPRRQTPDHSPPQCSGRCRDSPLPTRHAAHKSPRAAKSLLRHPSAADTYKYPPSRPTCACPPAARSCPA